MKKRTKLLIIIITALIVVLGAAGILWYTRQEKVPQEEVTVRPVEEMVIHDLSASHLYIPGEIIIPYVPDTEMIVEEDPPVAIASEPPADRETRNLPMASSVPEGNEELLDTFYILGYSGYGETDTFLSKDLEYTVAPGDELSVTIMQCGWAPTEYDMTAGVYCMDTQKCYGYPFSFGFANWVRMDFPELPEGKYRVYVSMASGASTYDGGFIFKVNKDA